MSTTENSEAGLKIPAKPATNSKRNPALRRWLPLAGLAILMAIAISQGWYKYLSLETLAINEQALHAFVAENRIAALALYGLIYIVAVALSLPGGLLLTLAGGFLFGWFVGGSVAVISATIGATAVFVVAKSSIGDALAGRAGPRLAAFRDGFARDSFNYLLFLRLVPVFPFWLVNIAPALLGVRLRTYVLGTLVGIIPGGFAFSVVGAGLNSVIDAQMQHYDDCVAAAMASGEAIETVCAFDFDTSALITPGLLWSLAALGVLALVPIAAKKVLGQRSAG